MALGVSVRRNDTDLMNAIVEARPVAPDVKLFRVDAPKIARRQKPGQFVIVRVTPEGERVPLTIADADPEAGTITLVVQTAGKTTMLLNSLEAGDEILDLAGPLGTPTEVADYGLVVVVGGGVGTAVTYPTAMALAAAGNAVIAVIGARSEPNLVLEDELRAVCDEVHACTDDGSYGRHGLVTDALAELLESRSIDRVFAAGPVRMMQAVAEATRSNGVPTVASLNPIMVDGTGMCGGCRVSVGGTNRFACLDGPDFDAHLVDFTLLEQRNRAYADWETERMDDARHCMMTAVQVGEQGDGEQS